MDNSTNRQSRRPISPLDHRFDGRIAPEHRCEGMLHRSINCMIEEGSAVKSDVSEIPPIHAQLSIAGKQPDRAPTS
jgi:hypothetical protein